MDGRFHQTNSNASSQSRNLLMRLTFDTDIFVLGFISKFLYAWASSCIRFSFLCFYARIVGRAMTWKQRSFLQAISVYNLVLLLVVTVLSIWTCV
jgi:Na+/melibiose symporter-like transporter